MKKSLKIAGGLTLVLTLWLLWFGNTGYEWVSWVRAPCYPDECYCEAPTFAAIEQPSNTYSNLPFVFVGLWIIFRHQDLQPAKKKALSRGPALKKEDNEINQPQEEDEAEEDVEGKNDDAHDDDDDDVEKEESGQQQRKGEQVSSLMMMKKGRGFFRIMYGLSVMVMGLGSLFYHGSLTAMGKFTDWFGMFLFASYLVAYNWSRWRQNGSVAFFAVRYGLLNSILLVVTLTIEAYIRSYVFFLLLAMGAFSSWYLSTRPAVGFTFHSRYAIYAVLLLGLAFFFWCLDKFQIVCSPHSLLQGHATWHALTAIATAFVYFYFLSESKKTSPLLL